jgi:ribosomal-protein-alanine N-acetyltransferase
MQIRPMTDDDLDRVMELENAIFSSPWRRSFFKADANRPGGLCVVAEEDGRILGYAVAWGSVEVHLANLAVDPDCRREGIGRMLMAEVIGFAQRNRAESIYLEVRVSNTVARQFYAEYGFVPTYLRKGYYENGEDAIVMERDAEPGAVS